MFELEDGRIAVKNARKAIEDALEGRRGEYSFPKKFEEKRGAFVTLKKNGELRGCIGYPYPIMPLSKAIIDSALSAAFNDPRFPPVVKDEMEDITVEVTILTPPVKMECKPRDRAKNVIVGKHGLMVRKGIFSGLLLPQVAVEYGWDSEEFLSQTCWKAGLPPDEWLSPETEVYTFEGKIFAERAPRGDVEEIPTL